MIGFFPEPYPDELFFSICSRYAEAAGYPKMNAAVRDLFDSDRVRLSVDFPSNLGTFVKALPPGHCFTVERLINEHTLTPFFAPFVSRQRLAGIRRNMESRGAARVHGATGVNTFKGKLRVFRYCPSCVVADRDQYGETYWHRIHHVGGLDICAVHNTYLKQTEVPLRYQLRRVPFASAEKSLKTADLDAHDEKDDGLRSIQSQLASNARWLLEHPVFPGYERSYRDRYVYLLYARGFCTYGGVLDRRKLANEITLFYSSDFLKRIKCEVRTNGTEDWLNRLVHRKEHAIYPIHHLLLLQFLGQSAPAFFDASQIHSEGHGLNGLQQSGPFGAAPWPCLNPIAEHFRGSVVVICDLFPTQNHPRQPRGVFRCSCGFAYSRVGPDKSVADRYVLQNYVTFGEQWDNALREMVKKGWGIKRISGVLQCSMNTTAKQLHRLQLYTAGQKQPYHRAACVDRRKGFPADIEKLKANYRTKLLDVLANNPELSRSSIRTKFSGVYSWLYDHDRDWLLLKLPLRRRNAPRPGRSKWQGRDAELAQSVVAEAQRIRTLPGRPVKASATVISDNLGITNILTKRPELLPLTNEALLRVSERWDGFAVRRIEWTTAGLAEQRLTASSSRITALTGLSPQITKVPLVRAALDNAVALLQGQMELNYPEANAA